MLATIKRWLFEPPRHPSEDVSVLPYVCADGPLAGDMLWLREPQTGQLCIGNKHGRYVGVPWNRGEYFSLTNKLHWEELK